MKVDPSMKKDLAWFSTFLHTWNGKAMINTGRPSRDIVADACPRGFGAADGERCYSIPLPWGQGEVAPENTQDIAPARNITWDDVSVTTKALVIPLARDTPLCAVEQYKAMCLDTPVAFQGQPLLVFPQSYTIITARWLTWAFRHQLMAANECLPQRL